MDTFGDRLRHRRESLKMSRRQLAEEVGLSGKTIQRYEERDEAPERSDARQSVREIADALRTRVQWLTEGHGEPELIVDSRDGEPRSLPSEMIVVRHEGRIPKGASSYGPIPDQHLDKEHFSVLFGGRDADKVSLYRMASSCAEPYFFPHEDIPVEEIEKWEVGDLYVMEVDGRRRLARIVDEDGDLYGKTLDGETRFAFDDSVSVNGRVILNRIKCEVLAYLNGELITSGSSEDEAPDQIPRQRTLAG